MQQLPEQRKFCQARELLSDNQLQHLAEKYHRRHPTFTIDIEERTCQSIILVCVYYYRHIEVDLRCECVYNDNLQEFESTWSTDHVEYQGILHGIFSRLIKRSLDDQIEFIIEQITKYFTRLKPIQEEERQHSSTIIGRRDSTVLALPMEIIRYKQSPQSRRKEFHGRSSSWSQSFTTRSIQHSNTVEEKV